MNNETKTQSPNADNLNSVSTNNPTAQTNQITPKTNTNKNVTNEQLLEIAKNDAKDASEEAKN